MRRFLSARDWAWALSLIVLWLNGAAAWAQIVAYRITDFDLLASGMYRFVFQAMNHPDAPGIALELAAADAKALAAAFSAPVPGHLVDCVIVVAPPGDSVPEEICANWDLRDEIRERIQVGKQRLLAQ